LGTGFWENSGRFDSFHNKGFLGQKKGVPTRRDFFWRVLTERDKGGFRREKHEEERGFKRL